MAEWLIVAVPLLLLPVILLLAYSGCAEIIGIGDPIPLDSYKDELDKDGPAGWWRLNEAKGKTQAEDSGPNKLHGTYNGNFTPEEPSLKPPHYVGTSVSFNQGYVEIPYDQKLNGMAGFSVEAWIRPTSVGPGFGTVVAAYTTNPAAGFDLTVGPDKNGTPQVIGRVFPAALGDPVFAPVPVNQWSHVVMTYTPAKRFTLYIDGARVKDPTLKAAKPYESNKGAPLRIGAGFNPQGQPDYYFHGGIDEVSVYLAPLTDTQVGNHFSPPKGS